MRVLGSRVRLSRPTVAGAFQSSIMKSLSHPWHKQSSLFTSGSKKSEAPIAAEQGFEPQFSPPEGDVLPLHHSAINNLIRTYYHKLLKMVV